LEQQGGYDEPWVLKIPDENNRSGITMLGPNSKELHRAFDIVDEHLQGQQDEDKPSRMTVQYNICNELTCNHHHKFDLRVYWAVLSIDPLIVAYHDGYVHGENANYDKSDWSSTRQHLTTHTFLADEEKGTMEQLKSRIGQHYHDNKQMLKHIRVNQVTHVWNQFKAAIAQTAAVEFKDVTFGNDKKQLMTAENAYQYNGADFVIDNNLVRNSNAGGRHLKMIDEIVCMLVHTRILDLCTYYRMSIMLRHKQDLVWKKSGTFVWNSIKNCGQH
jgi:hypothetical protein